jgi:DNA-directed RNA polymerase specialized sigma24 family protein
MLAFCDFTATFGDNFFSDLFRRCGTRVTSGCFRLTREVFFKTYLHRHSFRGDSELSTWLCVITRSHSLSSLKKIADPG